MRSLPFRLLAATLFVCACCACWCAASIAQPATRGLKGVVRLYVAPFPTKPGAAQLEKALIAELHHLDDVTIVRDVAAADATMHGDGEVWLKGYRSLNPRSGRMPSNGKAVYGGFLSVEVTTGHEGTLWSDLASENATEEIYASLARQVVTHLIEARRSQEAQAIVTARTDPPVSLMGAGATFPAPIYRQWFSAYAQRDSGVTIAYDAVGSEEGARRLLAGRVDFGACDHPAILRALAPDRADDYTLVPTVIGAVVPIVNLPGLVGEIALTPDALAGIFLGTITTWSDPLLREANRGLSLPNLPITVVHRADGSGTSYTWTEYLATVSPAWKARVGVSASPRWPIGEAASDNEDVARHVARVPGAIGYVEFIYALHAHLGHARIRNRAGAFVAASLESIAAAAAATDTLIDADGPTAWPITTFTWLVIPTHVADAHKRHAIDAFLHWMLTAGQRQAAMLGYLPLPRAVASQADARVADTR